MTSQKNHFLAMTSQAFGLMGNVEIRWPLVDICLGCPASSPWSSGKSAKIAFSIPCAFLYAMKSILRQSLQKITLLPMKVWRFRISEQFSTRVRHWCSIMQIIWIFRIWTPASVDSFAFLTNLEVRPQKFFQLFRKPRVELYWVQI